MRESRRFRIPVGLWVGALALALPAAPGPSAASATLARAEYAARLVEEARRRNLHEARYWHTLLHYKRSLAGLRSLVDDPEFFASPQGKHDPAAELAATLQAFFQPQAGEAKHPVCRFVARYHWLKAELHIDPAMLPVGECEPFSRLIRSMQPESTTLVFPTSHMNSPASLFGHTFLAYETASGSRLLAQAVNYSAVTTETFGPLFAVKGIVGLYKGYFSVLPYYTKLQEYSDIDHRDMWEYPLNFTREETIRSIMHVYELDAIYSDYYFFDENCSYNLLFLLDAGRPGLALTDGVPPWVIPIDTVRAAEAAGLVAGSVYRPSRTARIQRLAAELDSPRRRLARALARGDAAPAPAAPGDAAARTYDLAVEYLQYLYSRRELSREVYTDRLLALLTARSAAGGAAPATAVPPPARPQDGHRSNRLQLGAGLRRDEAFQEARFRFAYHTLLDHQAGYPEGAQIVFADTALRYYVETRRLRLQQFDLVDIVSIAPRDDLFAPVSWKITAGLAQRVMRDGEDHLIGRITPGAGLAYRIPLLGLAYAMLEADANVGEALEARHALGAGGSLGILRRLTDRWQASLSARGLYYALGDRHGLLDVTLAQNYALTPNLAISLDVSRSRTREFYRTEGKLALNIFF
ncbi:MAG: DUF4105 domain-containing protein [Candidatus Methylomirabilales bacterium]